MISLDKIQLVFRYLLGEGEVNVFQIAELAGEKYYTFSDRALNLLFGTDKHHTQAHINIRVDWFVNGNHYVKVIAHDSLPFHTEDVIELLKKHAEQLKKARRIKEDF